MIESSETITIVPVTYTNKNVFPTTISSQSIFFWKKGETENTI